MPRLATDSERFGGKTVVWQGVNEGTGFLRPREVYQECTPLKHSPMDGWIDTPEEDTDQAQFVEITSHPEQVDFGAPIAFTVRFRNLGTTTWTAAGTYTLDDQSDAGWVGTAIGAINPDPVAPGATASFGITTTAPGANAGIYRMKFQMEVGGVPFGQTAETFITVNDPGGGVNGFEITSHFVSGTPGSDTADYQVALYGNRDYTNLIALSQLYTVSDMPCPLQADFAEPYITFVFPNPVAQTGVINSAKLFRINSTCAGNPGGCRPTGKTFVGSLPLSGGSIIDYGHNDVESPPANVQNPSNAIAVIGAGDQLANIIDGRPLSEGQDVVWSTNDPHDPGGRARLFDLRTSLYQHQQGLLPEADYERGVSVKHSHTSDIYVRVTGILGDGRRIGVRQLVGAGTTIGLFCTFWKIEQVVFEDDTDGVNVWVGWNERIGFKYPIDTSFVDSAPIDPYVRDVVLDGISVKEETNYLFNDFCVQGRGSFALTGKEYWGKRIELFYLVRDLDSLVAPGYDPANHPAVYTLPQVWLDAGGGFLTEWVPPPAGYS